jgi:hypothetical protein
VATTQYALKITKSFPYRGAPKNFSNKYFFDGGAPTDSTAWHALMDAVVLIEKTIFVSDVTITECNGYGPTSDVAVATKAYTTAGTLSGTGLNPTPGECCAILRMATTKISIKNHPVYVFSYFHRAMWGTALASADSLGTSAKTAIEAYADDWLTGISVGGRTYKRTTPDGHPTTGRVVDPFIGHRDFPR